MSATNHTTNYELPIFVGTDKPAWLVDWNGAMTAIDTAIHTAEGKADQAGTDIGGIESSISTINSTLTSINNAVSQLRIDTNANTGSINTITSLIGNGEPTTTDKTIIGAINEINAEVYDFSLSQATATPSTTHGTFYDDEVHVLLNSAQSVGKVYGTLKISNSELIKANTPIMSIAVTGLSVAESFNVGGYGITYYVSGEYVEDSAYLKFNTNGTIDIQCKEDIRATATVIWVNMPPCLLFLKDLGD